MTTQLNKDLTKKDREVQQRKSIKYIRDINDFRNDQVFKWQSQLGKADAVSTYSTPEKLVRVYSQQTHEPPTQNTLKRGHPDPREGNEGMTPRMTPRQQTQDERYANYDPYTPYQATRRPQYNDRTPQQGGKKPFYWKNNRRFQNWNNWYKPPYDQKDSRGPPQEYRDQRRPPYEYRDNRRQPYDYYGPRGRSPVQEYGYGERRGPQQRVSAT